MSFFVKVQSLLARTVPSIFCICIRSTLVPWAMASSRIPPRSSSAIQGGLYPHARGVSRIRGAYINYTLLDMGYSFEDKTGDLCAR
jgi:hypothetical protein